MTPRERTVLRATAALAGYDIKRVQSTRGIDYPGEIGLYAGWHYRHEGRWIGAFKTLESCLTDVFVLYLGGFPCPISPKTDATIST